MTVPEPAAEGDTEPPPTYMFAVALTILLAIMLFFSTWRLLGIWVGEVLVIVLLRIACLVGIVLGVRQLIARQRRSVRTIGIALAMVWLSVILEGAVWQDVGWFLRRVMNDALYSTTLAAMLLALPVVVLLLVNPTQEYLTRAAPPAPYARYLPARLRRQRGRPAR